MTILIGTLWLLAANLQPNQAFNFTEIEQPIGAFLTKTHDTYISFNNWKLLYYYELDSFYENTEMFRKSLNTMEIICYNLPQCEAIITKYKERLIEINQDIDYFDMIQAEKRKRRAPLGFLGEYFYKPVFGLMDEEDARHFSHAIELLTKNQKTQSIVLENHMSIVKQFIRITNETMEQFRNNIDTLNNYINNYTIEIAQLEKEIKQHLNFEHISSLATLISADHERMTRIMKNSLQNTLQGDYTELITHEQLSKDLLDISEKIDKSTFIVVKHLKHIQQIVSIKATIKEKRLLIEMNIPILNKNMYTLHNIIPLPIKHDNEIIIFNIESRNFLVDNQTRTYILIDKMDLQYCKPIFTNALLCFPQTEMYFENQHTCLSNILFRNNIKAILKTCNYNHLPNITYIKRLTDNSYFITTPNSLLIRENCFRQASILHTVKSTGILKINANCEIITNGMKIFTKNTKVKDVTPDLASSHKITNISISNTTMIDLHLKDVNPLKLKYLDFNDNFNELINKTDTEIKKLHAQQLVYELEYHITEKFSKYIVIALVICIILRILYKKC